MDNKYLHLKLITQSTALRKGKGHWLCFWLLKEKDTASVLAVCEHEAVLEFDTRAAAWGQPSRSSEQDGPCYSSRWLVPRRCPAANPTISRAAWDSDSAVWLQPGCAFTFSISFFLICLSREWSGSSAGATERSEWHKIDLYREMHCDEGLAPCDLKWPFCHFI